MVFLFFLSVSYLLFLMFNDRINDIDNNKIMNCLQIYMIEQPMNNLLKIALMIIY